MIRYRSPGGAAIDAGVTLACQPNALSVARAGLDAELDVSRCGAPCLRHGRSDTLVSLACSAATRALDVELHPSAHLRDLAGAMALRAGASAPPEVALPLQVGQISCRMDLQPRGAAADRRPEIDRDLIFEIGAWLGARARCWSPALRKHAGKDVPEAAPASGLGAAAGAARSAAGRSQRSRSRQSQWALPAHPAGHRRDGHAIAAARAQLRPCAGSIWSE